MSAGKSRVRTSLGVSSGAIARVFQASRAVSIRAPQRDRLANTKRRFNPIADAIS